MYVNRIEINFILSYLILYNLPVVYHFYTVVPYYGVSQFLINCFCLQNRYIFNKFHFWINVAGSSASPEQNQSQKNNVSISIWTFLVSHDNITSTEHNYIFFYFILIPISKSFASFVTLFSGVTTLLNFICFHANFGILIV